MRSPVGARRPVRRAGTISAITAVAITLMMVAASYVGTPAVIPTRHSDIAPRRPATERGQRGRVAGRHFDHAAGLELAHDAAEGCGLHGGDVHCGGSSQPFDQPFFIALTQALAVGTNALTRFGPADPRRRPGPP